METSRIELVPPMSNREFIERYAQAGRVGLAGGPTLSSKVIQFAERRVDDAKTSSLWSHAFLFEGRRADGQHWIIESDMEIHRRHIRLGVQENRAEKLFDAKIYSSLAILDFGLNEVQVAALTGEGLEMVARRYRYSLRELFGTLVALRHPALRDQENPLAREMSCYCSAFVKHVFEKIGIDLAPGLHEKTSTPEDISRTPVPHVTYVLRREKKTQLVRRKIRVAVRNAARKLDR